MSTTKTQFDLDAFVRGWGRVGHGCPARLLREGRIDRQLDLAVGDPQG